MSLIVVDVEADGPAPGIYSMVSFGAIIVEPSLNRTFYGETSPISEKWIPEALAVSKVTREQHLKFDKPEITIPKFANWIEENSTGQTTFITDNLAFDWQFINYYMYAYNGVNPFGWSGRRIGDLYSGLEGNFFKSNNWKRMRKSKHTHNPVDDARGNAEALLEIAKRYNLKLPK